MYLNIRVSDILWNRFYSFRIWSSNILNGNGAITLAIFLILGFGIRPLSDTECRTWSSGGEKQNHVQINATFGYMQSDVSSFDDKELHWSISLKTNEGKLRNFHGCFVIYFSELVAKQSTQVAVKK
jgi:hypothetical protein